MASEVGMQLAEDQIKVLEENFTKVTKHPDETTLMLIAAEVGLSEEDTAVSTHIFVSLCEISLFSE